MSLQRCFQIGDSALPELLEAAASTRKQLTCIALSHLQLQNWPPAAHSNAPAAVPQDELTGKPDSPMASVQQVTPTHLTRSGLQVLALHNCSGITAEGLHLIASACPQLCLLFLGGSTIQVPKQSQAGCAPSSGYIPMLNSIPRSRAATIAGVLRKAPTCHHPSAHLIAEHLAKLVLQLRQLLLLEITFLPHGVLSELRSLLADSPCDRPLRVLNLGELASITAAIEYGSRTGIHSRSSSEASGGGVQGGKLKMLLEAAANCSNAARQTPLHVAVDVDNVAAVEVRQCSY